MWSSNRSEPTFLLPGRNGSGVAESDSFLLGDDNPEIRKLFRNACKVVVFGNFPQLREPRLGSYRKPRFTGTSLPKSTPPGVREADCTAK